MIYKGSDQYFKTRGVRTVPRSCLHWGNGFRGIQKAKAERRLRAAFLEAVDAAHATPTASATRTGRDLPEVSVEAVPEVRSLIDLLAAPPPEKSPLRLSWEIAAALDAALPEDDRHTSFHFSPEDISAALDQVFPEQPKGGEAAAQTFEISYETELKYLVKNRLVDPDWVPSGILRFPCRPGRSDEKN